MKRFSLFPKINISAFRLMIGLLAFTLINCEPIVIVRELPESDSAIVESPTPIALPTETPRAFATIVPTVEPSPTLTPTPLPVFTAPAVELARFGEGRLHDMALSPNGTTLAVATSIGIWLYDTNSWQPTRLIDTNGGVRQVEFFPDNLTVAAANYNHAIDLWRVSDGALISTLTGADNLINGLAVSPDSQKVASVNTASTAHVWRVSDQVLIHSLEVDINGWLQTAAFSPDGQQLALGGSDNEVRVWQLETDTVTRLSGHTNRIFHLLFSTAETLISSSNDGSIRVWRPADGSTQQTLTANERGLSAFDLSADGNWVAAGSREGNIYLWQMNDGSLQQTIQAHGEDVERILFLPNGNQLLSLGADNAIRLWQLPDGSLLQSLVNYSERIRSLALSPDGAIVAAGGDDAQLRLWGTNNRLLLQTLPHGATINAVAFSADGSVVASAGINGNVQLWRTTDGLLLQSLPQAASVLSLDFNPQGNLIMVGLENGTAQVWRIADRTLIQSFDQHKAEVLTAAFSPDGQNGLSSSVTAYLWQISDGLVINRLADDLTLEANVALSANGQLFAAVGSNQIEVRRFADQQLVQTIQGHVGSVTQVAFDPNGERLASGGEDSTLQIWRIADGALLQVIDRHTSAITALAFSTDGQVLASASVDGTVRLWQSPR